MPVKKGTYGSQGEIIAWGWFALLALLGGTAQVRDIHNVLLETAAVLFTGFYLWCRPAQLAARDVMLLAYLVLALVAAQLLPLPFGIWQSLPGHEVYAAMLAAAGIPPTMRPVSISPDLTLSALTGLLPLVVSIAILRGLDARERRRLAAPLLGVIVFGALLGMLQIAGGAESAFRFYRLGTDQGPTGLFSNRNHHALLLAAAIPMSATVLGLRAASGKRGRIELAIGLGLIVFLMLAVLVAGSRGGLLAAGLGLIAAIPATRAALGRLPATQRRWLALGALVAVAAVAIVAALMLARSDRALALSRLWGTSAQEELRWRTVRPILDIAAAYFPVGTGFGTFDPAFRAAEPLALLKPTYLNEAHNEPLQVLVEGGVLGVALMLTGIVAVVRRAAAARNAVGDKGYFALLGGVVLLQVGAVSAFDYPLRTPFFASIAILAFFWLRDGTPTVSTVADGEK